MGHVGGRFSVGELHAASKTSSANGSHLNVWDFDISAAEFPQQKKRASLVWIDPKPKYLVVSAKYSSYAREQDKCDKICLGTDASTFIYTSIVDNYGTFLHYAVLFAVRFGLSVVIYVAIYNLVPLN